MKNYSLTTESQKIYNLIPRAQMLLVCLQNVTFKQFVMNQIYFKDSNIATHNYWGNKQLLFEVMASMVNSPDVPILKQKNTSFAADEHSQFYNAPVWDRVYGVAYPWTNKDNNNTQHPFVILALGIRRNEETGLTDASIWTDETIRPFVDKGNLYLRSLYIKCLSALISTGNSLPLGRTEYKLGQIYGYGPNPFNAQSEFTNSSISLPEPRDQIDLVLNYNTRIGDYYRKTTIAEAGGVDHNPSTYNSLYRLIPIKNNLID